MPEQDHSARPAGCIPASTTYQVLMAENAIQHDNRGLFLLFLAYLYVIQVVNCCRGCMMIL